MNEFIPSNFKVPEQLETNGFRLRMLTIHDLEKDYEAVMSSTEHLRGVFGPKSVWPKDDLSKEQDLIDLGWHQKEFQKRSSFAYTVMTLDESRCLGCIYIMPSENLQYDAMVVSWVRASEVRNGLDEKLYTAVKSWINFKWPFKQVAYPGREITWAKFLEQG